MPTVLSPSVFIVFVAGMATIITPSAFIIILSVLSGSVGSKFRPIAIVTGMSIAFTLMSVLILAISSFLFFTESLRWIALFFIIGIGGTLLEDIYEKRKKLPIKFGITGVTITIIAFIIGSLASMYILNSNIKYLLINVGRVGIVVGPVIIPLGIVIFVFSELNQIFVKISDSFRKKVRISFLDNMYPLALREGLFGGFFLGISLGILWIPSVGPILGSVLAYVATSTSAVTLSYGAVLLIVYILGFSIPVLIIVYFVKIIVYFVKIIVYLVKIIVYLVKMISNNLGWSLKRGVLIKKLSGLVLILIGLIMLLGIDKPLQVLLLPYFPIRV